MVAGSSVAGVLLALAWPLYSLLDLRPDVSLSPAESFESSDDVFYESLFVRLFPAVLGLPVLWRRWRADRADTMTWLVVVSLLLWLAGLLTGVGRPLIFAVLVLQIAIGDALGRIEAAWRARSMSPTRWAYVVACSLLAVVGLVALKAGPARMLPEALRPSGLASNEELERIGDQYGPSVGIIGEDDVVLASNTASEYLPAFTGRQVSSKWANPLADDDTRRRQEVGAFLEPTTSDAKRQALLEEFGVRWIVLSRADDDWTVQHDLRSIGVEPVYQNDEILVLRVPT
jgi:hypothetical protein